MKKFFVKNYGGFTLVELMVVVAIIGILSSIAVPNFKKYQAKAKQSEAKIQLAALYSAEVGSLADYDTYATCLTSIGYEAPARGYYLVGFKVHEASSALIITARGGNCLSAVNAITPLRHLKANNETLVPDGTRLTDSLLESTKVSTEFKAAAVGNITNKINIYDNWTITHTKEVKNTTQGY
jgi:type IV pilus assembly protein PilA